MFDLELIPDEASTSVSSKSLIANLVLQGLALTLYFIISIPRVFERIDIVPNRKVEFSCSILGVSRV